MKSDSTAVSIIDETPSHSSTMSNPRGPLFVVRSVCETKKQSPFEVSALFTIILIAALCKVKLPAKFKNHVVNQLNQKKVNSVEMKGDDDARVSSMGKLDVDEVREGVFGNTDYCNMNDEYQRKENVNDDDGFEKGVFGNMDYCNNMHQTPNVSAHVSNNDDNEDLIYVHTVESSDESITNEDEEIMNNCENIREGTQCKNGCNLDNTNTGGQTGKARGMMRLKLLAMMWGKYGLRKIASIGNGNYVFKFNNENRLQTVIENGVWIVNNKPMVVQKWDIDVDISKVEPDKMPIWVKLVNLPLEA
ncbi:zinc knuckle CX2CX4HX4C containing protein [Tanacetum coccineum]